MLRYLGFYSVGHSYKEFCSCNNCWQFGLKYFLSLFFLKRLHCIYTGLLFFIKVGKNSFPMAGKIGNRLEITGEATEGPRTGSSNHSFERKILIGRNLLMQSCRFLEHTLPPLKTPQPNSLSVRLLNSTILLHS